MKEVHPTAARGFDIAADAYERARPGYPDEAVDHVVSSLPPGGRVLDLAAGTGKFTRSLVARELDVVAVEPVEGMRARFQEALPGVGVLAGTAEQIPLPDASVDLVVVAQAFHWFDHEPALAEIARVLGPRGALALIWNVRDERTAWVAHLTKVIRPHEGAEGRTIPRHREEAWRAPVEGSALFRALGSTEFEHGQQMDLAGLVERVASTSFIAVLPDDARARVLDEVRAMPERFEQLRVPRFVFPYVTEVHAFVRT